MLDQIGKAVVDQGGPETDDENFLAEGMEYVMAISEDEPTLREALNGDEREVWFSVAKVWFSPVLSKILKTESRT